MDAEIKVAEAMRDYARTLEDSPDPDTVIAAAREEKYYIEKLDRLSRLKRRGTAGATAHRG
jgi:hypothetical protein